MKRGCQGKRRIKENKNEKKENERKVRKRITELRGKRVKKRGWARKYESDLCE